MSISPRILVIALLVLAAAAAVWFTATPGGDRLAEIKRRGTLIVGVRADYPPFGYKDEAGKIVGFEPDLARDVAERLGVDVEFVPVIATDRMQLLQKGEVDLVLAAMADRPERRDIVWFVEPGYYAAGANVLVRAGSGLSEWSQLEGWPICAVRGSFFNEIVAEQHGARILVYRDTQEALDAFRADECKGVLFDESWLLGILAEPAGMNYELPLSNIEGNEWAAAVQHGSTRLHKFMERTVRNWHASGVILRLERTWGVRPSEYAARMNARFREDGDAEQDSAKRE